jgi:nicotinamidase-related amidase
LTDRESIFGEGMWGGDGIPNWFPQAGDVVIQQHWGQNGFANTDLGFQLRQRGIEKIIVGGGAGQYLCRKARRQFPMKSPRPSERVASAGEKP